MNDFSVSKNFNLKEFQCKCGCGTVRVKHELVEKLQKLRDIVGKPLSINSGYRCESHNKKIGGAKNSQHMLGMAVDVKLPAVIKIETMKKLANEIGFTGIGLYNTFIHLDVRKTKTEWDERK